MKSAYASDEGIATMLVGDSDIAEQISVRLEKLDEHAREIISALAERNSQKRKEAGVQGPRSEEEMELEDWFEAEKALCVALLNQVRQDCECANKNGHDYENAPF